MKEQFNHCLRSFLLVFNFFLLFVGLIILGFGTYLYLDPEMQAILQATGRAQLMTYFTFALIALGALTLVASLIGCCGSYHENSCLLGTYFTFLIIAFSIHIAIAVLIFLKINWLFEEMDNELKIGLSRKSSGQLKFMDVLEKKFSCCGVTGPNSYHEHNIPLTCCISGQDCNRMIIKDVHSNGCEMIFRDYLYKHFNGLCLISASIAAFEIFALLSALIMCCTLRQDYMAYDGLEQTVMGYYGYET